MFDGTEKVEVDPATGDLVLTLSEPSANSDLRTENSALVAGATLRLHKPVVYQLGEHGEKHLLAGTYVFLASESSPLTPHVAFKVASYNASKPLIIDPVLSWATYLGGSGLETQIAMDATGSAYVTGLGPQPFPGRTVATGNILISPVNTGFVTKLNPAGTAIVYSTYLPDTGVGIAVDAEGNAYVTGARSFVVKLNPAGTAFLYYTDLFSGSGNASGTAIAVDATGNAYVTAWGKGNTPGFLGTAGSLIQSTSGGGYDAFVAKLNAAGALVYSTYLGSRGDDFSTGIAVDATGSAYVTGYTHGGSGFLGTAGSLIQSTSDGSYDAFVTKINAAGTALVYSTYLGGSGTDVAHGIAVDAGGNAYVTGSTDTPGSGFPGTASSLIEPINSSGNAFVTKLNPAGTALVYSTYLGSSAFADGRGIAVDATGSAYVTGYTTGSGFSGTAGSLIQSTFGGGGSDAFVTKLNPAGTALVYSTYLGGSGSDRGTGIAVDAAGSAYVTGFTKTPGSGFPGTAGSLIQSTFDGGSLGQSLDGFVAKISSPGVFLPLSPPCATVISGLTFNRKTQAFQGTIRIINCSGHLLVGPLRVELHNLTTGVTLVNASGIDNGNPYVTIAPDGLAAGESVTVPVSFSNPSRVGISYSVEVLLSNE